MVERHPAIPSKFCHLATGLSNWGRSQRNPAWLQPMALSGAILYSGGGGLRDGRHDGGAHRRWKGEEGRELNDLTSPPFERRSFFYYISSFLFPHHFRCRRLHFPPDHCHLTAAMGTSHLKKNRPVFPACAHTFSRRLTPRRFSRLLEKKQG